MVALVYAKLRSAGAMLGVWYAICLHLIWAVLLLCGSTPLHSTALHGPALLFPNRFGLALLLTVVAGSAIGGIFQRLSVSKVLLLVPQQVILGMSSAAALYAMIVGHFADGVPRSHLFITADQAPAILALLVHSLSILVVAAQLNGWIGYARD